MAQVRCLDRFDMVILSRLLAATSLLEDEDDEDEDKRDEEVGAISGGNEFLEARAVLESVVVVVVVRPAAVADVDDAARFLPLERCAVVDDMMVRHVEMYSAVGGVSCQTGGE